MDLKVRRGLSAAEYQQTAVTATGDGKLLAYGKAPETQGLSNGAIAGALGLADEVPFIRETTEIRKAFNPNQRGAFMGEITKSVLVPQLIEWTARQNDLTASGEVIKRAPRNTLEYIKTGIPGLRQEVPRKKEK